MLLLPFTQARMAVALADVISPLRDDVPSMDVTSGVKDAAIFPRYHSRFLEHCPLDEDYAPVSVYPGSNGPVP
jgi:hypothetical protein